MEIKGYVLEERESTITFVPKVADQIVFGGINIFDKNTVQMTPEPVK
jgi:hypothetical protein